MIIVIILAVVANTMAMTTRERIGEYAIYKTLGFGTFYIWGLIWGEALVIALSGGLLGMALTYPVARIFSNAVGAVFPVFNVDITTIYMDFGVALTVGTLATILPARHACKISIVDGLKEDGDNFLSVRSGPGTTFRKIDELKNGAYVFVFDDHGDWRGVIYGSGKDVLSQDEIGCGFVGEGTRPMTYPGKKGWIHMNWVVPSDIG